jgi:hypothetical protein
LIPGWAICLVPELLQPLEFADDVVGLEGHVMRAVFMSLEEPHQEVVEMHVERLEQLDGHAAFCVAQPDLHRPEPHDLPAADRRTAQITHQSEQRFGYIRKAEGHVV